MICFYGTRAGGVRASATNKAKHGADFYKTIGAIGGKRCVKKGFGANPDLASRAGQIGGLRSGVVRHARKLERDSKNA